MRCKHCRQVIFYGPPFRGAGGPFSWRHSGTLLFTCAQVPNEWNERTWPIAEPDRRRRRRTGRRLI